MGGKAQLFTWRRLCAKPLPLAVLVAPGYFFLSYARQPKTHDLRRDRLEQ
jgi:hypothetical protein